MRRGGRELACGEGCCCLGCRRCHHHSHFTFCGLRIRPLVGVAGLDASSPGRSVFHRSPRSSLTKPILAVGAEWDREQPLGRQSGRLLPTPLAVPAPLPSAAHSEVSHCSFGPYGRPGVNISSAMKPAVHMMSFPIHSGLGNEAG